ncbi:MAG: DUF349 domain-containing protein [Paludibacteraceae bacterium]|nr:DUF349 domain-containing protein [Paludibacteraceae bacterium]
METNPNYDVLDRNSIVSKLQEVLDSNIEMDQMKNEVENLKSLFYSLHDTPVENNASETVAENAPETEAEPVTEDAAGPVAEQPADEEANKTPAEPSVEERFKAIMAVYRQRRAEYQARIEAEQQENLVKKQAILDELGKLSEPSDNLGDVINQFHELQNKWKEIGQVPAQQTTEIYNRYKIYQEQFYDLIKINAALRDYDFKRNLEQKQSLIDQAKALLDVEDVVKAFQSLQNLHAQWREIGPVAKDLREEIWGQFKEITSEINRRHMEFFEKVKQAEAALTAEKDALCHIVEDIDIESLKTAKDWDEKTKQVIELNDKFQSTNQYEHRVNSKMYHRYREACDKFFEAKRAFFDKITAVYEENYAKKQKIVEIAEQLKNSTEWQSTATKLQNLQKQWREIGPIPRKYSNDLWDKFRAACDTFFEQRKEATREKTETEQANKEAKLAVIEEIKAFKPTGDDEADQKALQELQDKFTAIGHIPFHDKDKVYNMFREAINPLMKNIRLIRRTAQLNLQKDRNSLRRQYDTLRQQLATYENNMGFFHNYPKDNPIIRDLERKIESIRQDIEILRNAIDEMDNAESQAQE